jgi:hypothetical protein
LAAMGERARKAYWSEPELDILRYLMVIYGHRELNYERAARLFENRTPADVKKRCTCIRDLDRRKERRALEAQGGRDEPPSPTSVLAGGFPPEGRLHPEVVWVPATMEDIGWPNL